MTKQYPQEFRDDVVKVARLRQSLMRQIALNFGILAASQVMAHIEKPDSPDSQIVVPTTLVTRQSVLKI